MASLSEFAVSHSITWCLRGLIALTAPVDRALGVTDNHFASATRLELSLREMRRSGGRPSPLARVPASLWL